MSKTYYVCKYTPVELLKAFGGECEILNEMPEGFDRAEQVAHPNICGFGKSVLEEVLAGNIKELVLVNCCDTIRSVYDILEDSGQMDFLYMIDMLHCDIECSRERTAAQLKELAEVYGAYKGTSFNVDTPPNVILLRKLFWRPFSQRREHRSLIWQCWEHVWDRNYLR